MKEYYILRSDGSSIFELPYREDFCAHCLLKLLDRTPNEVYYLCEIASTIQKPFLVSITDSEPRRASKFPNLSGSGVGVSSCANAFLINQKWL